MEIWVDADACPAAIKEILFRAAQRTGIKLTLVANQPVRVPPSRNIKLLQVSSGFDVADDEIVRRLGAGDLVITGDIPLAAKVIDKGGHALNPRGELYSADNIGARLAMRDFMDTLRSSGVDTGGTPALSQSDRKAFADGLDKLLTKRSEKR
ncbi:MAG: YaiI/YqxD family protein [Gammaproteobacteria bacterium]|nr:YaiI/YqxD family protein [Gammaproteobacteria bacterium]